MEIQIDEQWINASDLMHIDELRQETENKNLQSYLTHIGMIRQRIEALQESNASAPRDK